LPKQFAEDKTSRESTGSPLTQLNERNLSSIAANSPSSEDFGFKTNRARAIFDYLVKSFSLDYMTKRLARDDSGWRSLGEVVQDLQISTSIVYSKKRNQFSPPVQELLSRGFVERRFFQGKRGRGGEIMRLRVAYENDLIKEYVERKIRLGSVGRGSKVLADHSRFVDELLPSKIDFHRIAVLPFANFSPDPSDEYFADGLTEELISTLSKISQLRVSSRTSIMSYKQMGKRLGEMAAELNVDHVLEGSVRKMGDELRISVQLIDVQKDEHLWSQDYDRKFENIFSLQRDIALKVADSLKISILSSERKLMRKRITQNVDAYALYLKGRSNKVRSTPDSFNRFVGYCKQAIEKDPNFAQAYAQLAFGYANAGDQGLLPPEEAFPLAESLAEKAVQLDSSDAFPHISLGAVNFLYKWDFQSAEAEFRRATELEPALVEPHLKLAYLLACLRKFDEALNESKKALDLDPFSALTCLYMGSVLFIAHQYAEALAMLNNAVELDPGSVWAHDNLGCVYIKMEEPEKAILEFRKAIELGAGDLQKGALGYATARAGKEHEARIILDELINLRQLGKRAEIALAVVCTGLGDHEEAISWLESAYEFRLSSLYYLYCDPLFDDLHAYPKFRRLMKKIGF